MISERRKNGGRVVFDRPIQSRMMGIDGTWHRECRLIDISDGGAKIEMEGDLAGLNVDEFFLMM